MWALYHKRFLMRASMAEHFAGHRRSQRGKRQTPTANRAPTDSAEHLSSAKAFRLREWEVNRGLGVAVDVRIEREGEGSAVDLRFGIHVDREIGAVRPDRGVARTVDHDVVGPAHLLW